jgi:tetratricopeptide (TPR) repeat protein
MTQIRRKNLAAFGILFFLLSISILCNVFVTIGVHYAERLLYYPLLGFCIAAVSGLFGISKVPLYRDGDLRSSFAISKIPIFIVGGFIVFFSLLTILRNPAWESSYSLYKTDIEISPNSAKLNYHYGLELVKKGVENKTNADRQYLAQAKQQFEKALQIRPSYADAHAQLGLAFYRENQKDKAMSSYEKSLSLKPNNAKVYSNMGILYFESKQLAKAEEVYRKAVKLDPRFVDARRNLGSVLAMQGKFSDAIVQFEEGVKYAPEEAVLHYYLGQATKDSGNPAGAKVHFDKAFFLDPSLKK